MTETEQLIDSRTERDRLVRRTDVLDKVKALSLLPDDLHLTTLMVAQYFEVPVDTMKSIVKNNRDEIAADGYRVIDGEQLRSLKDLGAEVISDRWATLALWPRRAVLRAAMLLRGSMVAQQVRTALLDTEAQQRGGAATVVDFSSTEAAIGTLTAMLDFLREKQQMELVAAGQQQELNAARPKAAFVDRFVAPTQDATKIRVFAAQLGLGEYALRGWLADRKIVYRRHAGQRWSESRQTWVDEYEWTPYSGYRDWFVVRDQPDAPRLHNGQLRTTMYVSPLGKEKIRALLARLGGPETGEDAS